MSYMAFCTLLFAIETFMLVDMYFALFMHKMSTKYKTRTFQFYKNNKQSARNLNIILFCQKSVNKH